MVRSFVVALVVLAAGCGGSYAPEVDEAIKKFQANPTAPDTVEDLIAAGREALDKVITILQTEPKEPQREAAARILGAMRKRAVEQKGQRYLLLGRRDSEKAGQALASALSDTSKVVRRAALAALREFELAGLLDPVVLQLREEDPSLVSEAIQTLVCAAPIAVDYLVVQRPERKGTGESLDAEDWEEMKTRLASPNEVVRANTIRSAVGCKAPQFREALLVLLKEDEVPEVRAAAVWALACFQGEDVREALQCVLREDDSPRVALAAATVLAESKTPAAERFLSNLSRAVDSCKAELLKLSKDAAGDEDKRAGAIAALGRLHDAKAAAELYGLIDSATEPKVKVRRAAASVVAEELPSGSKEALRRGIADTDEVVRLKAAQALATLGETDAIDYLTDLLRTKDGKPSTVRIPAAEALGQIGSKSLGYLLKKIKDSDPMVRWGVAYALGLIGDKEGTAALVEALGDESAEVRAAAAVSLGQLGSDDASAALVNALSDSNKTVRWFAQWALKKIPKAARPALQGALKAEPVPIEAVELLGLVGGADDLDRLAEFLTRMDPEYVRAAAFGIGQVLARSRSSGGDALAERLAKVLTTIPNMAPAAEKEAWVQARREAANALGCLREGAPLLRAVCLDPDPRVSLAAAAALGRISGKEMTLVECLGYALEGGEPDIRRAAARKLAELSSLDGVPYLEGVVNDPDTEIRETAREALLKLTGFQASGG